MPETELNLTSSSRTWSISGHLESVGCFYDRQGRTLHLDMPKGATSLPSAVVSKHMVTGYLGVRNHDSGGRVTGATRDNKTGLQRAC